MRDLDAQPSPGGSLVGREREMALLSHLLELAAGGDLRAVLIVGQAWGWQDTASRGARCARTATRPAHPLGAVLGRGWVGRLLALGPARSGAAHRQPGRTAAGHRLRGHLLGRLVTPQEGQSLEKRNYCNHLGPMRSLEASLMAAQRELERGADAGAAHQLEAGRPLRHVHPTDWGDGAEQARQTEVG